MSDLGPEPQQDDGGKGRTTIAVDFDGVLHAYSRGWDDGTIYDGPVAGSRAALVALDQAGFKLVVFTARDDLDAVGEWLGYWYEELAQRIAVTNRKPIAALYIDDRAIRFRDWHEAIDQVVGLLGVPVANRDEDCAQGSASAASGSEQTRRTMIDQKRLPAIPDEDRTWNLIEDAYSASDGITVLGWADDMVLEAVKDRTARVTFDVEPAPRCSHEDEVLVVAIRVPHPDQMSLAEVVLGCSCCDLDGSHRHGEDCMHPCCPDGDDG